MTRARYTYGGDEFLFVEVSEEMSLAANFTVTLIARELQEHHLNGVIEICPANASLLIRFNPEVIAPGDLEDSVRSIEEKVTDSANSVVPTRIIEVPVWYDDPVTAEVVSRFREGYHQDPSGNDLDYAATVNGLEDASAFIRAHHQSPWIVSMVGFVAGLPFMYQLVDREHQLEVPKYLSPRTDTAPLTVGHGGCFAVIYSVRGAGGYQMFGIAAAPIYHPELQGTDQEDQMILFRPGDIVKFRPVEEAEYRRIQQEVEAGSFRYRQVPIDFDMERALEEGAVYNTELVEALNVDGR
ncbi:Allophanate hydrolase, subunit 1 [Corynebacterium glyciniphilum AJ 3170]|uniref:Allophanate hydrolase, subunit 1 n=1 Tax=Corynebacterium glyciniphilum AJ 3170 TaxID=1404245 RepID=X5ED42_9CORY|nr:carboxyltransferase domain-containing protein [Corynebacterium glyciniphilum]AHW64556.1 Allophanate hydrolase, subunit 1 [Corynebacterium glyciniphilum AJ 3170]